MHKERYIKSSLTNWVFYGKARTFCLSSFVLMLMVTSGYLFYEEQRLKENLANVTREAEMLNAEVPDSVIKYAPLLVDAEEPEIKELATALNKPEEIYLFVRDKIEYSQDYTERRTASDVLNSKQGDCLGKADLLAALLLARGYTDREVFVNMGHITYDGVRRHHAWVEFNYKGKWLVLDSSQFLGKFEFERWDKEEFYQAYRARPYAEFNDGYAQVNFKDKYPHV